MKTYSFLIACAILVLTVQNLFSQFHSVLPCNVENFDGDFNRIPFSKNINNLEKENISKPGDDWIWITSFEGAQIPTLVSAKSDFNIIYAGTWGNGIYKSCDGGKAWVSAGLNNSLVDKIIVSNTDPNIVWALVYNYGFYSYSLFKTLDGGESWHLLKNFDVDYFDILENSPINNDHILAKVDYYYPYRIILLESIDGGIRWDSLSIYEESPPIDVKFDSFSPNTYDLLFSTFLVKKRFNIAKNDTIFLSDSSLFSTLLLSSFSDKPIYIGSDDGIYKSEDRGQTWFLSNNGLQKNKYIEEIYEDNDDSSILYCIGLTKFGWGKYRKLYRSADGGNSWKMISNDQKYLNITLTQSTNNHLLTSIFWSGIYSTADYLNWDRIDQGIKNQFSTGIVTDKNDPQKFMVSNLGIGILKTEDAGLTWKPSNTNLPTLDINKLLKSPFDDKTIFAGTFYYGLYKSKDSGNNWVNINGGTIDSERVEALAFDPNDSLKMYVGTRNGLFKTTNGGLTWNKISKYSCFSIAVNPFNSNHVLADKNFYGILISKDGGATWENEFKLNARAYSILFYDSLTAFLSCYDQGIWKTTDGGYNWVQCSDSLPARAASYNLALYQDSILIVDVWGHGLYASNDQGISWINIGEGLPNKGVSAFTIVKEFGKDMLYVCTYNGIYKKDINQLMDIGRKFSLNEPKNYYLSQNYPNPFNPTTTIKYALPKTSKVKLEVFNLLGQKVATLVNGRKAAGYHKVTFNGSGLPSGVYYYRLQTDRGSVKTRKLVLLK